MNIVLKMLGVVIFLKIKDFEGGSYGESPCIEVGTLSSSYMENHLVFR